MTIASEITRLQNDKAAICAAIENKGVTVGNVTLDNYAACIDAIQSGGGVPAFCYFLVGGGAGGAKNTCAGGGGGAGEALCGRGFADVGGSICVCIGSGGAGVSSNGVGNKGCNSCLSFSEISITAKGGCTSSNCIIGGNSGSGCVGGVSCSSGNYAAGGGGGTAGNGFCSIGYIGGAGGLGITYCGMSFAGGGGGGTCCCKAGCIGHGCCGGGDGGYKSHSGHNATTCGSGGGGAGCGASSGAGAGGAALISYPIDGSYGFTTATGGNSCFTCNGYCVHCFTSNGTFTVVS